MNLPASLSPPHPWLERFRADPAAELDEVLSGLAWIPPYERATPSETLNRLFGGLPKDAAELRLLDAALRGWLEQRRRWDAERRESYGLPSFVAEYMDALSVAWLLALPETGAWLQAQYFDLATWAAPLRLSKPWDLPRALAQAAALTQRDQRLRFYWFRLCGEAAQPSRRVLIDAALSGLGNLPGAKGRGASPDLIGGLARFGAGLEATPRDQADFLRRWRGLKVRFPRASSTWQKLWHGVLDDSRYRDKPFRAWLLENDGYLGKRWTGAVEVQLPSSVQGVVESLNKRGHQESQRGAVLDEAEKLIGLLGRYAEATGDAYFLVRSACNLGKELIAWAPGHALAWAREALRWSPTHEPAWDMRGRALVRLGRDDLAETVYWEAIRRLPDKPLVRCQLGLLLQGLGRMAEAEALFREAHAVDSRDEVAYVELAQLLARTGREPEAEQVLRRGLGELPDNPIIPYTLASLLIAWNRPAEAREVRDAYVGHFGRDRRAATLDRLLTAGAAGVEEVRQHLALRHPNQEESAPQIQADQPTAESQAETEQRGGADLRRSAQASRADLLFRVGDMETAAAGLAGLLKDDADDLYARVVWGLHDPAQRLDLAGRYRDQFGTLAPHLAAADDGTPDAQWQRLLIEFPERAPLIDLARVLRGSPDPAAAQRLGEWLETGDTDGDAYLRAPLRSAQARDGGIDPLAPGLQNWLDAAICREVEIADPALFLAAGRAG